jgi:heme-degrading monooxygenase HmoA
MTVYVFVRCTVNEGVDPTIFEKTFEQVSRTISDNNPELIKDKLIRNAGDPRAYILLSEWKSKEAVDNWRRSPLHMKLLLPLHDKWTMQDANVYETAFINDPAMR